ncbi:unnamed protein product [Nyctereutes procyonoides]|uniref:(raccoon dog) hypothetical protein n=1 Tax=Nyctereutes procyonoides TaxID=34880 RepID=A0A811ZGY4_NYCPR|nr:unnamed protein product [Nyctereutes procyonoides]
MPFSPSPPTLSAHHRTFFRHPISVKIICCDQETPKSVWPLAAFPNITFDMDDKLLVMDEQRNQFLEVESTLGEDAMKNVEMTTKDLEYDIHLIKQWQGLGGLCAILKEIRLLGKCYQTASYATEKSLVSLSM